MSEQPMHFKKSSTVIILSSLQVGSNAYTQTEQEKEEVAGMEGGRRKKRRKGGKEKNKLLIFTRKIHVNEALEPFVSEQGLM